MIIENMNSDTWVLYDDKGGKCEVPKSDMHFLQQILQKELNKNCEKKMTLEYFDLDVNFEGRRAVNVDKYINCIEEFYSQLRAWYKYGQEETVDKDDAWHKFHDILRDYNIDIDELY